MVGSKVALGFKKNRNQNVPIKVKHSSDSIEVAVHVADTLLSLCNQAVMYLFLKTSP